MKISTSDRQNDRHSDKIESPLCSVNIKKIYNFIKIRFAYERQKITI